MMSCSVTSANTRLKLLLWPFTNLSNERSIQTGVSPTATVVVLPDAGMSSPSTHAQRC
jgi:hypothetical protein